MTPTQTLAALTVCAARAAVLRKLVCSRPAEPSVVRATGTLCRIGGNVCLQIETLHADHKATHENLPLTDETEPLLAARFAAFRQVNLLTTAGDCEYKCSARGVATLFGGEKLRNALAAGTAAEVTIGGNDKAKHRILQGDEPFLRLLGVSDANGRVYDKKGAKFRQINRFLELIRDTLPHLPKGNIRICDLCCGKSYLSFAVYHYFANVLGYTVSMTGVDLKADVVAYCNEVAKKLNFTGLAFLARDIRTYESEEKPQLVISLHACDTATDTVLEKAMAWGAKVILSTPCCHHALNHTLSCEPLAFVAQHSMLRQKLCDAATDALRLKLLEANGYDTAALELIDPDDTPKNIMLRAIRRADAGTPAHRQAEENAMAEYRAALAFLCGGEN